MDKRKQAMLAMHEAGMTYEAIGKRFGISKQAAHQCVTSNSAGNGIHLNVIMKIPYVGLRMWMLENKVTVKELSKRIGSQLAITRGINPRMDVINKILKVTGLTYERCFNTEVDNGEKKSAM